MGSPSGFQEGVPGFWWRCGEEQQCHHPPVLIAGMGNVGREHLEGGGQLGMFGICMENEGGDLLI